MIACISPGSSSADHSLNTLRYADRLKERSNVAIKGMKYNPEEFEEVKPEPEFKQVQQIQKPEPNVGKNVAKNKKDDIFNDAPEKDNKHQKPETNLPSINQNQKQAISEKNQNEQKVQNKPPKGSEVSKHHNNAP